MRIEAREFNHMAENFYREELRHRHLREALTHLREDCGDLEHSPGNDVKVSLRYGVRVQYPARFVQDAGERMLRDELSLHEISAFLNLLVLLTAQDRRRSEQALT
jgi:hypothetical protein